MEEVLGLLTLLAAGIPALAKTFRFVHEGELGVKLRFGKAIRHKKGQDKGKVIVRQPGFTVLIPFVDTLRTHHVRQQTQNLPTQRITLIDDLTFEVSAVLIYRVSDIYRALFEIDEIDESLSNLGMTVLRAELSKKDHQQVKDVVAVSKDLLSTMREKAEEWGVVLLEFNLSDCSPTPEASHLVNVRAGARLKVEALREAADKIGIKNLIDLNTSLGAVLVGMPFTATTYPNTPTFIGEESSHMDVLFEKADSLMTKVENMTNRIGNQIGQ